MRTKPNMLFSSSGLLGEEISSLNLCLSLKRLVPWPPKISGWEKQCFLKGILLENFGKRGKVTRAYIRDGGWWYKVLWDGRSAPGANEYAKRSLVMKQNSGSFRRHKERERGAEEMPVLRPPIIETPATVVTRLARLLHLQGMTTECRASGSRWLAAQPCAQSCNAG